MSPYKVPNKSSPIDILVAGVRGALAGGLSVAQQNEQRKITEREFDLKMADLQQRRDAIDQQWKIMQYESEQRWKELLSQQEFSKAQAELNHQYEQDMSETAMKGQIIVGLFNKMIDQTNDEKKMALQAQENEKDRAVRRESIDVEKMAAVGRLADQDLDRALKIEQLSSLQEQRGFGRLSAINKAKQSLAEYSRKLGVSPTQVGKLGKEGATYLNMSQKAFIEMNKTATPEAKRYYSDLSKISAAYRYYKLGEDPTILDYEVKSLARDTNKTMKFSEWLESLPESEKDKWSEDKFQDTATASQSVVDTSEYDAMAETLDSISQMEEYNNRINTPAEVKAPTTTNPIIPAKPAATVPKSKPTIISKIDPIADIADWNGILVRVRGLMSKNRNAAYQFIEKNREAIKKKYGVTDDQINTLLGDI